MSDTVRLTHKQLWTFPDGPDHVAEAAERLEEEAKKRGKTCVMDFNDIDLRVVPGVTTAARAVMDWHITASVERGDARAEEAKVMRARIAVRPARLLTSTHVPSLMPRTSASDSCMSRRSSGCQMTFAVRRVWAPTLYWLRIRPVVRSSGNLRVLRSSVGT